MENTKQKRDYKLSILEVNLEINDNFLFERNDKKIFSILILLIFFQLN